MAWRLCGTRSLADAAGDRPGWPVDADPREASIAAGDFGEDPQAVQSEETWPFFIDSLFIGIIIVIIVIFIIIVMTKYHYYCYHYY